MISKKIVLTPDDTDRVIQMAWEDQTPFEAIKVQFGLSETGVIALMRRELKPSGFRMWRARMKGRTAKHSKYSSETSLKFKSRSQRDITLNKISKR